ncbi:MAG: VCBS repeat-containing protein, partial [Planctomycetota bacterium]
MLSLRLLVVGLALAAPSVAVAGSFPFIFEASSWPLGICPAEVQAEDLNGDGILDIVVANHHSHDVSVLLGVGDGSFQAQSQYPVPGFDVAHDLSVTVADFNQDGHRDAAVVSFSNDEATVFLGDGSGALTVGGQFPVGDYPLRVIALDLDGDTDIDLVSVNRDSDDVTVLLGDGTGNFEAGVAWSVGDGP